MNYTSNYYLKLPLETEQYSIDIVNYNTEAIDAQMYTNASAITIQSISVNGTEQTISDKNVDIEVPELEEMTTEELEAMWED